MGLNFLTDSSIRSDDSAAAPRERVDLAAINLEGVAGGANAIALSLCSVFHGEDAGGGSACAASTDATITGKRVAAAARLLRTIAKSTGRKDGGAGRDRGWRKATIATAGR